MLSIFRRSGRTLQPSTRHISTQMTLITGSFSGIRAMK
jgi:hypothetical protein